MSDEQLRARLELDFASSFIRIRGAHNPKPGEPCAWCRLAAEQAAEAVLTNESLRAVLASPPASASPDRPLPPTGVQTMRRTGDVRAALRGG